MRPLRFFLLLATVFTNFAGAQQAVSRSDAIAAALSRGARLAVARADTAAARAQLATAGAFTNPSLAATYTKSVPQYHVTLDLPLSRRDAKNAG